MPRATAIAPPRSGAKMLAALTRVVSMDVNVTPCGRGIRFINSSKRERSTPAAEDRRDRRQGGHHHDILGQRQGRRIEGRGKERHQEDQAPAQADRHAPPELVPDQQRDRLAGGDEPDLGVAGPQLVDVVERDERRGEPDADHVHELPPAVVQERRVRADRADHLRGAGRTGHPLTSAAAAPRRGRETGASSGRTRGRRSRTRRTRSGSSRGRGAARGSGRRAQR